MILPTTGVNRPVFTSMIFAGILLFGVIAWNLLPRDMLPEIEIPTLTVVTIYPGASAADVESQVTRPLEEVLAGVNNLREIFSQSKENVSFITLQFDWNTSLDNASGSVRDFLEFSRRNLPSEASAPMIMRISSDMFPVLIYGVSAGKSKENLGAIIDDQVANALKRAPGVGALVIMGKPKMEIAVHVDPVTLNAYNLSISQISMALQSGNMSIPAGNLVAGDDELSVTVPAGFASIEDIENTVVSAWQGSVLKIKDIAVVERQLQEARETVRMSGEPAVGIFVQKQAGANILEVVEAVRVEMELLKPLLPDDVVVTELMDNSEMVTATLDNLFTTILFAGLFVVIVVFFFLRRFRSSLIVVLTIPFSLIVAFIFMYIWGFTINIFSLMSLAVAIGMVIDNAIVVLENISRHIEKGVPPRQAAVFGTREMGPAIIAATLTTIAVFIPLVFLDGVVGIMFRQLAIITAITLLASLFAALMLTPMLASRLLKPETEKRKNSRFWDVSEKAFQKLENHYAGLLHFSLSHRIGVVTVALVIFATTLFLAARVGTDYIPEFDAGDLSVVAETRVGASTEETLRLTRKIEDIFREEVPEIRNLYSLTGQSDQGLLSSVGFREGKNVTTVFARTVMPELRSRTSAEMAERLRERMSEIPEIENFSVSGGSLISAAVLGNVKPLQVKISGTDLTLMNAFARSLTDSLQQLHAFVNVENTVDRGKPELQLLVDKDRAAALGLNQAMVSLQMRQSIYGQEAGEFEDELDNIPINIRYALEYRNSRHAIERILLRTLMETQVPVNQVARVQYENAPLEIQRENQQRVVYVSAEPYGISLGEGAQLVESLLVRTETPEGIRVELGGQVKEQKESFGNLNAMFVIGLLLVFMVMASQFESLKHPFVILFTIPFSLTGVVLAFAVAGLSLSVVTFLGVIMLLGIVVNNGIVLVDYTNLLRERGLSVSDALGEAGRTRLRPVLMTSFTTMLGMVPMVFSRGIGSEIWSPLAITIIGGLFISTFITLLLVPVVYLLMNREKINNH
ncbi:MAG: efflux RND transporter permease subunit [Bacteroidetes bacterium]|nr:MAG: efflux RND transporter permease subunit [Bacteroidota bacterium]